MNDKPEDGTRVPRGFEDMLYIGTARVKASEVTADLKALDRLERACRAFEDEMVAAWPAVRRLADARYPGAEGVHSNFETGAMQTSVPELGKAIEDLRTANGDFGAALWLSYDRGKERLGDVLHELSYRSDAEDAIRAYLDYRQQISEGARPAA